jgi:Zn-dependent protease
VSDRETEPRERRDPVEWGTLYGEPRDEGVPYAGVGADEYSVERDYKPIHPEPPWRSILRKLWAPIAAIGFLFWKFKFVLVAIFKFKIFTVAGSMLVSVAAYALLWGWQFALGFVVLLFVHEMGHALEAKRQGIPTSAPLFIPFLGAVIAMKQMPHDVWKEAQIAIAGPILGTVGCVATWGLGEALDSDLLIALAFTGFFLNLFNLAPITPLDGGRIVAAIHPAIWALGLVLMIGLVFVFPNPILILILLIGGFEVWRRWQERKNPEAAEYYRISPAKRVAAAVGYVALAVLLVLGMDATFVERDL